MEEGKAGKEEGESQENENLDRSKTPVDLCLDKLAIIRFS